mgnify:CR=1 FL=1
MKIQAMWKKLNTKSIIRGRLNFMVGLIHFLLVTFCCICLEIDNSNEKTFITRQQPALGQDFMDNSMEDQMGKCMLLQ